MVGWHHQLNVHGFEWTPGVGDVQGSPACFCSWGRKESHHFMFDRGTSNFDKDKFPGGKKN